MPVSKALVWFRNSLRLADNEMLCNAISANSDLVLIYVLEERHWQSTPIGHPASSDLKLKFLLESIISLRKDIEALGGNLIVEKGDPVSLILNACEKYNCDSIYTTQESGTYEIDQLNAIESALGAKGKMLQTFSQNTLYHQEDIPWPIKKLPPVFTHFRKENEKQTAIRAEWKKPADLSIARLENYKGVDLQRLLKECVTSSHKGISFNGGESEGIARINYYLWETDLIKEYKNTRNQMIGADYSLKLSPWLAIGCISPKTIYYKLKEYEEGRGANQSTYWLFFELLWRDYFHFILKKHGSDIFAVKGIQEEPLRWSRNQEHFQRWCTAKTGVPFIDANMMELNLTGYMSNRGRQLVASFLTHDLNIDWRWGAWYFENKLIDYDVASNWGNWAYVAGVGNDPRKDRYFNILSQARKYDSNGDYVRKWLPFLSTIDGFAVHKIPVLSSEQLKNISIEDRRLYSNPLVELSKWEY